MEKFTELNVRTVPGLWERRKEIFSHNETDLSALSSIDSAGVAFLVRWSRTLGEGKLTLKAPPEEALRLIKTFKVEPLFEILA